MKLQEGFAHDVVGAPGPEHCVALGGDGQRRLLCSHGAKVLRALRALEELLHKLPAWHVGQRLRQDAQVTAECCRPSAGSALHTLVALPPER